MALGGLYLGWLTYRNVNSPAEDRLQIPLLKNKYYFDEFYDRVFVKPAYWFAENVVYKFMDQGMIDGILHIFGPATDGLGSFIRNNFDLPVINRFFGDGSADVTYWFGGKLRAVQTGRIQQYLMFALVMFIAIGAVLVFLPAGLRSNVMNFIDAHLLSLILFVPALAAVIILFLPAGENKLFRWFAFGASLIPLILSLVVWFRFDANQPGFQFEETYVWYQAIGSSLHLGVDGLSLTMVLLTTILMPLAILASFSINDRVKPYMMLFLFLETGMLGVFMALDLLIFFVFWEVGLVPMYFLINQWGSANRNYASLKFLIYTMGGSLGLLLAIQMLGVLFGTYDLVTLYQRWNSLNPADPILGFPVNTVKSDCILGVYDCLCDQGPNLALPHLAPRRAYRGANGRFDDPGGCVAQTRRVWFPATHPSLVSSRGKDLCRSAGTPCDGCDRLWRARHRMLKQTSSDWSRTRR